MEASEIRCKVELREDAGRSSPGRLVGTLLTYGERAGDRPEMFEKGALTWPAGGVVLRRQHERGQPILRFTPELRGDAVVVDEPLPDTSAGRDAAAEIRSGLFRGLSVEFKALRDAVVGGVRRIASAELVGAGLVDDPAYPGAAVAVRHKGAPLRRWWL